MEQGETDCRHRDLSLLPPDLTARILTTLELHDQLAAAAVCRSWRAAYKADPWLDAAPLFRAPCLVFHAGDDPESRTATLRSLADGDGGGRRVHYRVILPDPAFLTRHVVGSSHGWLATVDERSEDILLVNPVTRAQVTLPPIRNHINPVEDHFPSPRFTPDERRWSLHRKVVWSSDPTSGNCIVMIIHHPPNNIISFATVGDTRWSLLKEEDFCRDYDDFFYSGEDGLLYAIRANDDVHAVDLHAPFPTVKVIFKPKQTTPPVEDYKYIVRAPWGDILRVSWCHDYDKDGYVRTSKFVVYKIDCALRRVVKVKDLRGHALFIGFNNSSFVPTDESSMIKRNRVFHADDLIHAHYICEIYAPPGPRRLVEVNLEDGSISDVWPSPNLWSNWPPPVWLTPTLSQ